MKYFNIYIVLFIGISFLACKQEPSQDGLVAHYPFNGDAQDLSMNKNHGVVNGATPTTNRYGNKDKAFSFDGLDDFIQINNDKALQFDKAFTISLWFKGEQGAITDKYGLWDKTYRNDLSVFGLTLKDEDIKFRFRTNKGRAYSPTSLEIKNHKPSTEEWNHVVSIWDGNNKVAKLYINNILIDSLVIPCNDDGDFFNTAPLLIGTRTIYEQKNDFDDFFKGNIDDYRLYNRALNEKEIKALFQE